MIAIVIPTYNKLEECLRPCLESIRAWTNLNDVEVFVVANGCTDGTRDYVTSLQKPFHLIWHDNPIGYTSATNEGIKAALQNPNCDFVVLLNNDVQLLPQPKDEWLHKLQAPFLRDPTVAVTGPMKRFSEHAQRDFLIFFCAMIRRTVFDKIGILDECFSPGYGEDVDFAARAQNAGYKVVQVPDDNDRREYAPGRGTGDFRIYHEGNVTFKKYPDGDKILERNWGILAERYSRNMEKAIKCLGYTSTEELRWLAGAAATAKIVVEVGSWYGRSTLAMAENTSAKIFAVDHWNGSENERETNHAKAKDMGGDYVFYHFLSNLFDHIQSGKVVPLRMNSIHASDFLKEKNVMASMIFIDASHDYQSVKDDIEAWWPVVEPGGILCGHDFRNGMWPDVTRAVYEKFPNAEGCGNTTIWMVRKPAAKNYQKIEV